VEVPLDRRLDLDMDAMLAAIADARPSLIFLSYPNNPTGRCFDRRGIERILEASGGLVVVDEAYGNFSGKTFLGDLDRWDNLVVLRTLSKVGLAALRLGILIGHPSLVHQLNKVRLPYNVNIFFPGGGRDLYRTLRGIPRAGGADYRGEEDGFPTNSHGYRGDYPPPFGRQFHPF